MIICILYSSWFAEIVLCKLSCNDSFNSVIVHNNKHLILWFPLHCKVLHCSSGLIPSSSERRRNRLIEYRLISWSHKNPLPQDIHFTPLHHQRWMAAEWVLILYRIDIWRNVGTWWVARQAMWNIHPCITYFNSINKWRDKIWKWNLWKISKMEFSF